VFIVAAERRVDAQVRDTRTPREVRLAYTSAVRELEAHGCAAASYRLSGPDDWPRHCVKTLPRGWKLVMDFPESGRVRLLILQAHTNSSDPYQTLARLLDVTRAPGLDTNKPGCCNPDGTAP
jgi:hypothetical protein